MSSIINKLKEKTSHSHPAQDERKEEEQQFTIQPHPARSNNPADLQPREGLQSSDPLAAHKARGPLTLNDDLQQRVGAQDVTSRDELKDRQRELNQGR